mgnify:CR=1 FL=1
MEFNTVSFRTPDFVIEICTVKTYREEKSAKDYGKVDLWKRQFGFLLI